MSISEWSTTPGNNDSAPPTGAPEGMAANAVNNTMREMMADVKAGTAFTVDTVSDLKALDTDRISDGDVVSLKGYNTITDEGGSPIRWDSASTDTEDNFITFTPTFAGFGGTGRWKRSISTYATPIMAGVVDDGSDQSAELNALFAVGVPIFMKSGTYVASSVVEVPFDATIEAETGAIIDFSGATVLGNFPDNVALNIGGGSFTSISALGSNATRGDFDLTFATDPATTQGDILVAYNPTNGSFNGASAAYHAGEYFQVAIDGGTTQTVNGPIFDSYVTTAVDMYKLNGGAVNISGGLKVVGPDDTGLKTVRTVRASFLVDCNIDINVESKSRVALGFKNCFNVGGLWRGVQVRDNTLDDYGLVISNCQHMRGIGYFYGVQHGVTTGGDSAIGSIVNRDVQLKGYFACSDGGPSALLWHGNSEFCIAEGAFHGAVTTSGDNMIFRGSVYAKNNGVCIQGSELLGLNHDFDGMQCYSEGDPDASNNRGVIDFGGGSTEITANTTRGGKLRLSNLAITAPQANGILIKVVNRGATFTQRSQIDLQGTTIVEDSGALTAGLIIQNVSVDDFDVVNLHGIDMGVNDPGYSTMDVTAIRGWSDSGTVDILTDIGVNVVTDTITFNKKAPQGPNVTLVLSDVSSGGDKFVVEVNAQTTTTATVNTYTIDGTNFGGAVTIKGIYNAGVNQ